mgnify:CR=1 FL=1
MVICGKWYESFRRSGPSILTSVVGHRTSRGTLERLARSVDIVESCTLHHDLFGQIGSPKIQACARYATSENVLLDGVAFVGLKRLRQLAGRDVQSTGNTLDTIHLGERALDVLFGTMGSCGSHH